MNELNYASLEASKKLMDAGIVLETEAVWRKKRDKTGYYLSRKALYHRTSDVPAPSMAEVWRELPEGCSLNKLQTNYARCKMNIEFESENPTDALIDLLVWLKGEGK
jgi:hypothetical protein